MPKHECFAFRFDATMEAGSVGEVMVYSTIVSWKWRPDDPNVTATDFDAALKKVKDADRINLRINSPGGSVYQAVAMRAMMAQITAKEKHVYIEGLCASAATLLASAPGWTVHIAEGSSYMIHNPRSYAIGEASVLEKEAKELRKMEGDFRAMYARRSGKDEDTIKAWMDETHWFTASEAVAEGFADEVLESAEAVASAEAGVPEEAIALMRDIYGALPEGIPISKGRPSVRNGAPAVAAGASPEHKTDKEEKPSMDIKDITLEQLRAENSALVNSIAQESITAERQRIADIDDLTPAGYEQMAADAKKNGMSAMEYHKAIVKAQREKGPQFLAQRKNETAKATDIPGGSSEDADKKPENEMSAAAKEIADFAKSVRAAADGGMY